MSATTLAEGKTKIVVDATNTVAGDYGCSTCKKVLITSKDDITAGDGVSREALPGKGKASNKTTSNVFKLLKEKGVPTHFLSPFDDQSFLALRAEMIPLEVVTRRIATGSYLKRNPDARDGQLFYMLEYELFYKDDENHDPIVQFAQDVDGVLDLYKANQPIGRKAFLGSISLLSEAGEHIDFDLMRIIALQVFLILEEAWAELGVVLYDMKIEFGLVDDGKGGKHLVVADVIDNDSWRIRDAQGNQLDKQVFRDAVKEGDITEGELAMISNNYELVAKLSREFIKRSSPA